MSVRRRISHPPTFPVRYGLPCSSGRHESALSPRGLILALGLFACLFAPSLSAHAQVVDSTGQGGPDVPPPLSAPQPDTLRSAGQRPDTSATPAGPPGQTSGVSKPVQFTGQDSLIIVFDKEAGDHGTIVGNAQVTFGEATLKAHEVDILFNIDELRARGLPTDTGLVGRPQFQQGNESFTGSQLAFNLGTERGRVVGAQTAIEDGFISGSVVKVTEDSTLYIKDGAYTTCECVEDPSYSLRSSKMKIVDQKWIYTGPIQLYLFNIPTIVWLPFGYLPAQEGRRSGPLPPRYGEDERGFYLRDWGWYWAMNDYMDLQLKFGLWTLGSWQIAPFYRYSRRYHYTGQVQFDYVHNQRGERDDPDFTIVNTASVRWNHNQTLSQTANFSANVNLSTSNYLRTISENYDDRVRQTIESSIRYSKRWPSGGRSLTLNLSQRQVLATGQADLTIPSLNFSQGAFKPFERDVRPPGSGIQWYEQITVGYSATLNNRFNFTPLPNDTAAADVSWIEALLSPSAYRRATGQDEQFDFRTTHRVPVSASFALNQLPVLGGAFRLNVSPNFNYTEEWLIRTDRRALDSTGTARTASVPGFFSLRQFSAGVSANTTFYGLFPVRVGPLNGLRHTVRPSLAFTYRPDFYGHAWGYTRTFTDTTGRKLVYPIASGVQNGIQQALSFRLENVFETKRALPDSVQTRTSRTLKLLDLDASSSYNFAADSLKLSDVQLSARTNILGRFDLSARSTLSPYSLNAARTRVVDDYVFSLSDFRIARLTRLDVTMRTSFRSSQSGESRTFSTPRAELDPRNTLPLSPDDPSYSAFGSTPGSYADFAIPWSLNLDFTYGLSRPTGTTTRRAIVNAGFDFNLTPKWKIQGRTGYDLEQKEIVTTNLAILRDFECWEMAINWVPFGLYQSFSFDLHVKSGKLRDLLRLQQPRSDIRNRFGRLVN